MSNQTSNRRSQEMNNRRNRRLLQPVSFQKVLSKNWTNSTQTNELIKFKRRKVNHPSAMILLNKRSLAALRSPKAKHRPSRLLHPMLKYRKYRKKRNVRITCHFWTKFDRMSSSLYKDASRYIMSLEFVTRRKMNISMIQTKNNESLQIRFMNMTMI